MLQGLHEEPEKQVVANVNRVRECYKDYTRNRRSRWLLMLTE